MFINQQINDCQANQHLYNNFCTKGVIYQKSLCPISRNLQQSESSQSTIVTHFQFNLQWLSSIDHRQQIKLVNAELQNWACGALNQHQSLAFHTFEASFSKVRMRWMNRKYISYLKWYIWGCRALLSPSGDSDLVTQLYLCHCSSQSPVCSSLPRHTSSIPTTTTTTAIGQG